MRLKSTSLVLAIIAVTSSSICPASSAVAQEEAQPVKAALMRCFDGGQYKIPQASDPKTIPPGLIEGQNVNVVALPGTDGHAFSYEGTSRNGISCGIAIYGAVPASLLDEIRQLITSHPEKGIPNSTDLYRVDGVPAHQEYWGYSGLVGVLMLVRQPGPNAPTVEVQYHSILVH